MNRRYFIKTASLAASAMALQPTRLRALQSPVKPIIFDGMGEIRLEYPMSLLAEIRDSGMNAVTVTLGNPALHGPEAFEDALTEFAAYERHIDQHRDYLLKATSTADIDQARKQNRIALFYLFQNTTPISDNLTKLEFFYNLGVRSLQLTYNTRNLVGDGCMERTNAGLSEFGLKLIDRMNALGLLIDLSHGGEQTIADAAHFSQKPIVISHSGCKAVYNHPRNVSDENLKRLANAGGVIGIYQINPYLGAKERNNLDDYLRHIDHAVNVAGVEHVGIGSDREHQVIPDTEKEKRKLEEELARLRPKANTKVHWPFFLSELNHPRRMETIWDGLKKRGHAASRIEKILGGNFYRVYKEVIG